MRSERIYNGETSADIGIPEVQYESLKKTVDEFTEQWGGGDFPADFRAWLKSKEEVWTPDMASRGLGDTVAKLTNAIGFRKPCGGCKKRQNTLNSKLPYRGR